VFFFAMAGLATGLARSTQTVEPTRIAAVTRGRAA
jgi:hypothetical protein